MSRIAVVGGHGQVARHLLVALRRSEHDAVARDIDLDRKGLDRPVTPRDPELVASLADRYNLEGPATRLVEALIR